MTTNTAVDAGTVPDLAEATREWFVSPLRSGFRRSFGLWTGRETDTGTAEILSREMSGGIGALGQPIVRDSHLPAYEEAAEFRLPLGCDFPDTCPYIGLVNVSGGTGGGVGALSAKALPFIFQGRYYVLGGNPGVVADLLGLGDRSVPELLAESEYVRDALKEFRRLNAPAFRASPRTFGSVVEILNLSVRRGYHPVATVDETDNCLEIEARLDPNRLLILQVWPSGAADGLIFSDPEGFKSIEAAMVSDVVDWLVSSEHRDEPGHSFR